MEIDCWGNVQVCCNKWCNSYIIGNILENTYDEIWNGEKRRALLKQFEEQHFVYCDLNICPLKTTYSDEEFDRIYEDNLNKKEKLIRLNYDCSCNLRCIFCRDEALIDDENQLDKINRAIVDMLPMINENNIIISLTGVGEVFTSKRHIALIEEIVSKYPNIKISIITNGVLASAERFKELGLEDRIEGIEVSVHAYKKKTYDKLIKGGNFDALKKNLHYISGLKKSGKLAKFYMNFAFNSENY